MAVLTQGASRVWILAKSIPYRGFLPTFPCPRCLSCQRAPDVVCHEASLDDVFARPLARSPARRWRSWQKRPLDDGFRPNLSSSGILWQSCHRLMASRANGHLTPRAAPARRPPRNCRETHPSQVALAPSSPSNTKKGVDLDRRPFNQQVLRNGGLQPAATRRSSPQRSLS